MFKSQNLKISKFQISKFSKSRKKSKIFRFLKILVRRKIFFKKKRKKFFDNFFHFCKLHEHSFLTSYWTPPNSFWSPRTSYLNLRALIFYQGKPGEFIGLPWAGRYKPVSGPSNFHQNREVLTMDGPLRGLKKD